MEEIIVGDARGLPGWSHGHLTWWQIFSRALRSISAVQNPTGGAREEGYSLDEKSTVAATDQVITVPFTPLGSVGEQGIYSVQADVKEVKEPRSFTTRDGSGSWVRNIVVSDGKDELKVVLWGEKALIPVSPGDQVEVYHATAKPGRFGGIELGVGRGSCISGSPERAGTGRF